MRKTNEPNQTNAAIFAQRMGELADNAAIFAQRAWVLTSDDTARLTRIIDEGALAHLLQLIIGIVDMSQRRLQLTDEDPRNSSDAEIVRVLTPVYQLVRKLDGERK